MTSRHTLTILFPAILTACATGFSDSTVVRSGGSACLTQEGSVDSKTHQVSWCSSRQLFQPNKHVVTLNGVKLFDGTDYRDIGFKKSTDFGEVAAECTPRISITETMNRKPIPLSTLPPAAVNACQLKADERGHLLPFLRTPECANAYAQHIVPMVGKIYPFKQDQVCKLSLKNTQIFLGSFTYR